MNSLQAVNDTSWVATSQDEGKEPARRLREDSANQSVTVLSRVEHELISALIPIPQVAALYCEADADGLLMVFVVVEEHDSSVYDAVLAAEDALEGRIGTIALEIRVRAHQGRSPARAVPVRCLPLFVR